MLHRLKVAVLHHRCSTTTACRRAPPPPCRAQPPPPCSTTLPLLAVPLFNVKKTLAMIYLTSKRGSRNVPKMERTRTLSTLRGTGSALKPGSLLGADTSPLTFEHFPAPRDGPIGCDLDDVRNGVLQDTSFGDRVKRLALLQWHQYKEVSEKLRERVELTKEPPANRQKMKEPKIIKLRTRPV
ncbi:hypothetical protein ZWY2020_057863 [Hordeum vulgare]|nr:hypothetical protein ZWY2020_057863 [Hordeum vulgare]